MGAYIVRVISASLICYIALSLVPEGSGHKALKSMCGLVFLLVLTEPIWHIFEYSDLLDFSSLYEDAETSAAMGEAAARRDFETEIIERSAAYIQDKANKLNMEVQVDIELSTEDIPLPESVILTGAWEDLARATLSEIITEDLGIPEENQRWIGME